MCVCVRARCVCDEFFLFTCVYEEAYLFGPLEVALIEPQSGRGAVIFKAPDALNHISRALFGEVDFLFQQFQSFSQSALLEIVHAFSQSHRVCVCEWGPAGDAECSRSCIIITIVHHRTPDPYSAVSASHAHAQPCGRGRGRAASGARQPD